MRPSPVNTRYTANSIDHELLNALGFEVTDEWGEYLHTLLHDALADLKNQRIANVFRQYHGIPPYDRPYTLVEIADEQGYTRERAGMLYYRAAAPVFNRMSNELLRLLVRLVRS